MCVYDIYGQEKTPTGGNRRGFFLNEEECYFLWLPYRLINLSTRPAVSTSLDLPV